MAVEDEQEYESDPDEALLPSAMRRREASDDEDGAEVSDGERTGRIGSEEESDGQGGAPVYDDEDFDEEDEELSEEETGTVYEHVEVSADNVKFAGESEKGDGGKVYQEKPVGEGEEKKENEPFAVPTAGAFYMHDDRFRESGGGRHGRLKGGRRLWESKDEGQWVHDRFEEMSLQDSRHKGRYTKGRFRGRGGSRNADHGRGYIRDNRGNKSQAYNERPRGSDGRSRAYMDDRPRAHDEGSHQNHAPKFVRGRGTRRYEPLPKSNNEQPRSHSKVDGNPNDEAYVNNAGKKTSSSSNFHSEHDNLQKQISNSSLNSASPPFYPSGSSSTQEISTTSKRDQQTANANRNLPSFSEENFSPSHTGSTFRGRAVADPHGKDRYVAHDSGLPISVKNARNFQPTTSSSLAISTTHMMPRVHARGPTSQLGRGSAQMQFHSGQRSGQTVEQPSQTVGSQSPALTANSSEVGDSDSPRGSVRSVATVSGKPKASSQGSGRGGFIYGGAQVMGVGGAIGLAHGDQNFPGTPALLPVMQFGGQHPGVPTVGMALPGYVAQPQMGFGNNEMTWVPVLAGSSGALGGSYAPYLSLDGNYYACLPGQTSSSAQSSSRETTAPKASTSWKNPQRSETSNDEFGQRQNKPRRYSEMNFGQ
ncbi:CASC3/Barentsz eIF4AIII binding protein isoform X2 [Wolffia australiana]